MSQTQVKRYDHRLWQCADGSYVALEEKDFGHWVKASDYATLQAERDRLREALKSVVSMLEAASHVMVFGNSQRRRLDAARAALSKESVNG